MKLRLAGRLAPPVLGPGLVFVLAGCGPALDVDLVANAPVDGASVLLRLEGVDLDRIDGREEARTRGAVGEYRYQRDTPALPDDLLSNSDIRGGEYRGLRLRFAADEGSVARTGLATEFIEIGSNADAEVAFMIDGDEDGRVSLTVALDLILSLRENQGEAGFTLDPVLRAMERRDVASVSGDVAAGRINAPACSTLASRPAVYAFAGHDLVPDERDGGGAEPLAVSEISRSAFGAAGRYTVDYLPPGDYTLALTCSAQLENGTEPALDDATIAFFAATEITLDAAEQVTLNFLP